MKMTIFAICSFFVFLFISCESKLNKNNKRMEKVRERIEVSEKGKIGFVFVEGGKFKMGSKKGISDETPLHSVILNSFYICDHEVTQKEYYDVMGINPSDSKRGDMYPVDSVSWYDAIVYCNNRSIQELLTPCYSIRNKTNPADWGEIPDSSNEISWDDVVCNFNTNGYRLPTEAEWEYAARGGKKSKNFVYAGSNAIDDVAWFSESGRMGPSESKTKLPNELGLYDMSGNLCEWCWDWYGRYHSGEEKNPVGAWLGKPEFRVARGGCWSFPAYLCCVNKRWCRFPCEKDGCVTGIRVVCSAQ